MISSKLRWKWGWDRESMLGILQQWEVNVIQLKMEFMNLFIFTFPACLKQHLQVELAFARGRFSDSALDFPSKKLRREDLQSLHRGPPGEPIAAQSRCKVCPSWVGWCFRRHKCWISRRSLSRNRPGGRKRQEGGKHLDRQQSAKPSDNRLRNKI